MGKKKQGNNRHVKVLDAICPIHGPTELSSLAMGGLSLGCGCEWEPRWSDKRGDYWEQIVSGSSVPLKDRFETAQRIILMVLGERE